jgi:histidine ammonia-lyase
MKTLSLGSKPLTLEDVEAVSAGKLKVKLSADATKRIKRAHHYLLEKVRSGEVIYGVNTGFGLLSNVRIEARELQQLQVNLLRSHAVGTGEPLPAPRVRSMLLLRGPGALGSFES